jgi:hypothetical protein
VVAGALGKGRVVLMAPTLGVGLRNMEEPPSGSSMKLLLNVVRWLGGT